MRSRTAVTGLAVALALIAPASAPADSALPSAELVTVTDRGFAATWTTASPSDTTVCLGRPLAPVECETQEQGVRFHYAEVEGLEPGTRYVYALLSGGRPEPPSTLNPGSFKTLTPPPGRHLFDFALVSDQHIGEECSGTATTVAGRSVPPCFSADRYAARMLEATVAELNARGVKLTVLNADNTSHGDFEQAEEARQILAGLDGEWHVARGSHDRPDQNPPDPRCGEDNDCFREVFFPDRDPGRIFYQFGHRRHRFVVLDSADPASGQGDLTDPGQRAFLERALERARRQERRAFIFFHHPVSEYSTTTSFPPVIFGVRADRGGAEFLSSMARFPNVVGVFTAHTHRNFVSYSPATGARLPYVENGPTKEYPAGYSIVRVYEGGYMRTFHRLRCEFCREWTSTTRGEFFGLYPVYTLGTLSARNFSHLYDCDAPTPPPSLPPPVTDSFVPDDLARPAC